VADTVLRVWTPYDEAKVVGSIFRNAYTIVPAVSYVKEHMILVIAAGPQWLQPEFDNSLLRVNIALGLVVQCIAVINQNPQAGVAGHERRPIGNTLFTIFAIEGTFKPEQ
jgi:hypothetical protein